MRIVLDQYRYVRFIRVTIIIIIIIIIMTLFQYEVALHLKYLFTKI
jgi:hypothetical protein